MSIAQNSNKSLVFAMCNLVQNAVKQWLWHYCVVEFLQTAVFRTAQLQHWIILGFWYILFHSILQLSLFFWRISEKVTKVKIMKILMVLSWTLMPRNSLVADLMDNRHCLHSYNGTPTDHTFHQVHHFQPHPDHEVIASVMCNKLLQKW